MSNGPAVAKALGADDYDEMWRRLEDFLRYNPGARHRRRLVLRALRRHAGDATEVLDVGCGLGEMVGFLADALAQCRFTGVDFSAGAIDSCRRRLPTHRWAVADVVNDDLPGPYDAVVCSELLEHLDEPARRLPRNRAVLEAGRDIVVTVPNGKVFATERAVGHVAHPTLATAARWFDGRRPRRGCRARRWGWPGYLALKYAANVDAATCDERRSGRDAIHGRYAGPTISRTPLCGRRRFPITLAGPKP